MKRAWQSARSRIARSGRHRLDRRDDRRRASRPKATNIKRFLPRTIDEDQWQSGRPRAELALDRVRSPRRCPQVKPAKDGDKAPRQYHRPERTACSTWRVRSRRDPPSRWRASARKSVWCFRSAVTSPIFVALPNADANVCLYREYGRNLCELMERPYFQAPVGLDSVPPSFSARSAAELGLDPEPFIEREKHTTIKPLWDLWR